MEILFLVLDGLNDFLFVVVLGLDVCVFIFLVVELFSWFLGVFCVIDLLVLFVFIFIDGRWL